MTGQPNRFGLLDINWFRDVFSESGNHPRTLEKHHFDFHNGSFVLHRQHLEIRERNLHARLAGKTLGTEFAHRFHFSHWIFGSWLGFLSLRDFGFHLAFGCHFDYYDLTEMAV